MTLTNELQALKDSVRTQLPAQVFDLLVQSTEQLRVAGAGAGALREGDIAPDFALPDATGVTVRLYERLSAGPVVVLFYRGVWCPYCNLEIKAYQLVLSDIQAAGASLLAVSLQLPDGSLSMQEKHHLQFPVLSDVNSVATRAYGLAYDLPVSLQDLYRSFGSDLPAINGSSNWTLPIPATYVIATDGRIAKAYVDVDFTRRMEPQKVLDVLATLSAYQLP
jgi:peroxiredoxin